MAIVNDIVSSALRLCRIYDNNPEKLNNAFNDFNLMLKGMDEKINLPTFENFTLTANTRDYTIGEGADLNTIRPVKIISGFLRNSDNSDYYLNVNISKQNWDNIANKNLVSIPEGLYYIPNFPYGNIYFDRYPDYAYTFYLTSIKPYAVYTGLDEQIIQPPEFEKFLIYSLAIDIAPTYGIQLFNSIFEQYQLLKESIVNRYSKPVPEAKLDDALFR